jgi:hypothetical protein
VVACAGGPARSSTRTLVPEAKPGRARSQCIITEYAALAWALVGTKLEQVKTIGTQIGLPQRRPQHARTHPRPNNGSHRILTFVMCKPVRSLSAHFAENAARGNRFWGQSHWESMRTHHTQRPKPNEWTVHNRQSKHN